MVGRLPNDLPLQVGEVSGECRLFAILGSKILALHDAGHNITYLQSHGDEAPAKRLSKIVVPRVQLIVQTHVQVLLFICAKYHT